MFALLPFPFAKSAQNADNVTMFKVGNMSHRGLATIQRQGQLDKSMPSPFKYGPKHSCVATTHYCTLCTAYVTYILRLDKRHEVTYL